MWEGYLSRFETGLVSNVFLSGEDEPDRFGFGSVMFFGIMSGLYKAFDS